MSRIRITAAVPFALTLFLIPLLPSSPARAQEAAPDTLGRLAPPDTTPQGLKRMTVDDYAIWRSVGQTSLSPDGRWVTYAYNQREVDDSLFIEPLGGGDPHVVVRGSGPQFSADSRWVAYYVNPEEEEGGSGRSGGGGAPGGPPGGARGGGGGGGERALELYDLQTEATRRWENVQTFAFADAGRALVVKKRQGDSDADYDGTDLIVRYLDTGEEELFSYVDEWGLDERGGRLAYTLNTPEGESNGVSLLDLGTRARRVLDAEREAAYADLTWGDKKNHPSADALAVLKGQEDEDLVETENALLLWPALSGSFTEVVLDPRPVKKDSATADSTAGGRGSSAGNRRSSGNADAADARTPDPFPEDWVLSEKGSLRWAPDASRIFVATRPQLPAPKTLCKPAEEGRSNRGSGRGGSGSGSGGGAAADSASGAGSGAQATDSATSSGPKIVRMASRYGPDGRPLGPEEVLNGTCPEFVADVDIWHVQDDRLQSVQILRAGRDRNQTYMGVVHIDGDGSGRSALAASDGHGQPNAAGQQARFVQLADTTMEAVEISDNGRVAMGRNPKPYVSDWEPSFSDYYLVDMDTGERTPVLEKQLRTLGFSPSGSHFLYWKERNVWSYEMASGEHRNLTADVPVTFENVEYDRMGEKPPYGVAGWTSDSTGVILEHRYDLWLQPLDGGEARDLTGGLGARDEIRFRIVDLDPEEDLTDLSRALLLSAYGQWTKDAGFYRLRDGRMTELVMGAESYGRVAKADSTDKVLYTVEDFRTFPDYHVSGLDFRNPVQVTDANPQQAEFNWGRQILFDYETTDGVHLQGVLAIPDDYVEGEKRPMLVDFYEKNSQNLNRYSTPIFRDTPMFSAYVSAGYLVMRPDIRFNLGATHGQMLECINLAIDKVIEMGYVDPEKIGLHGHSFSGQGSVYISTHSDRFAAIVAGAAASDLVADFNQLWKSAGTNQHGYDHYGQGRFGTNPYDDLDLYIDQSATFNAGNMNTPLLLLHGTADGSVEWLQAVELFNGLRWFGKNVILMSYPGEPHHLRVWENQKDFQIRMRQFYDHYLWGKPAPRWMEDGRTFLEKERDRAMVEEGGSGGRSGGGRPGGGGS